MSEYTERETAWHAEIESLKRTYAERFTRQHQANMDLTAERDKLMGEVARLDEECERRRQTNVRLNAELEKAKEGFEGMPECLERVSNRCEEFEKAFGPCPRCGGDGQMEVEIRDSSGVHQGTKLDPCYCRNVPVKEYADAYAEATGQLTCAIEDWKEACGVLRAELETIRGMLGEPVADVPTITTTGWPVNEELGMLTFRQALIRDCNIAEAQRKADNDARTIQDEPECKKCIVGQQTAKIRPGSFVELAEYLL